MRTLLKRQRHKARAWRIQVFIDAALGVDAVKPAHDITVHHVDNRLCHSIVESFVGYHALLDDDFAE